jgi:MoxR-like ATPase
VAANTHRDLTLYVATDDLKIAVNAAIVLERPLLIKGEPGTGKTVLAEEVAKALGAPLMTWHIKSTTKAQQGLYEYDAVSRLRDSQLGDSSVSRTSATTSSRGKLWEAFDPRAAPGAADRRDRQGRHRVSQRPAARTRSHGVLRLRDRRDHQGQAPPDRHHHLEQREGTAGRVPAPLLLPLHQVPRRDTMQRIVDVHFPGIKKRWCEEALRIFFEVREVPGLKKKPSTSELLDWLKLLLATRTSPRKCCASAIRAS